MCYKGIEGMISIPVLFLCSRVTNEWKCRGLKLYPLLATRSVVEKSGRACMNGFTSKNITRLKWYCLPDLILIWRLQKKKNPPLSSFMFLAEFNLWRCGIKFHFPCWLSGVSHLLEATHIPHRLVSSIFWLPKVLWIFLMLQIYAFLWSTGENA